MSNKMRHQYTVEELMEYARNALNKQLTQPRQPLSNTASPVQRQTEKELNDRLKKYQLFLATNGLQDMGEDNTLGQFVQYAHQSPQHAEQALWNMQHGVGLRPEKGKVGDFSWGKAESAVIANDQVFQQMRDLGIFDAAGAAYDKNTIYAASDQVLAGLAEKYGAELSSAQQKKKEADANAAQRATETANALEQRTAMEEQHRRQWPGWSRLYNTPNAQTPEQDWAYADYLLAGGDPDAFDFDAVNAQWDSLSDGDFNREMQRLEAQYKSLDLKALSDQRYSPEVDAPEQFVDTTNYWQQQMDMVTTEQANRKRRAELEEQARSNQDFDALSVYDSPYAEMGYEERPDLTGRIPAGINNDVLHFINAKYTHDEVVSKNTSMGAMQLEDMWEKGYSMLTPDEVKTYTVLYKTDKAAAQEYLDVLSTTLTRRRASVEENRDIVYAEHPVYGPLGSVATAATSPVTALTTLISGATGTEDPNDIRYRNQQYQTTTRGTRGQIWGKAIDQQFLGTPLGTTIYNTLMSMGDMISAMVYGYALGGGSPNFAKHATQAIMSSNAASGTFYEDLKKGYSIENALLHGLANGGIEAVSEKIPLDNFFSSEGRFLWRVLKSGASEGVEEVVSGAGQIGTDLLFSYMEGKESEVQQVYNQYVLSDGRKQAAMKTFLHFAEQLALDGLSGMGSGLGFGTVTHTINDSRTRSAGKGVQQNGDIDTLISIAEGMGENSQARQWAERLKAKKGGKYSNYDVGRLTMALEQEVSAELAEAPNQVMDEAIEERLLELGETPENARALAPVVRQTYRGQPIKRSVARAVNWNDHAEQVVKELSRETTEQDAGRTGVDWATKAKDSQAATEQAAEKARRFREAALGKGVPKAQMAPEAEGSVKKSAGAAAQRGSELAEAGKAVIKDAGEKGATISFATADGDKRGEVVRFKEADGSMQLVVEEETEDGKVETTVAAEDVGAAATAGLGAVIAYVTDTEGQQHRMSEQEANTMLQVYNATGGDAQEFIEGYEAAYLAGYAGIEVPAVNIDSKAAELAYKYGAQNAQADEANRTKRASRRGTQGTGTVTWLGSVSSNAEVTGTGGDISAAMETMTESQRTTAEVVQALAKQMNIDVTLFESSADTMEGIQNGSFVPGTNRIYIDVNSGAANAQSLTEQKANGTLGYAMVKTMAHELTHYMESNSAEGYAAYKQAVKNALKESGQDWASLVRGKLDAAILAGNKLTLAGAEAEVIADASEYMLQNSAFVQGLDNSVRGKVKQFIQNFMEKVRAIFANLTGGHRESAALRQTIDGVMQYTGNLQRLWDAGIREATGRNYSENATMRTGTTVQAATDQNTSQTEEAVEEWTPAEESSEDLAEEWTPAEEADEEIWTPEEDVQSTDEQLAEEIYEEPAKAVAEERTVQEVIEEPTASELKQEAKATQKIAPQELIKGIENRFGVEIKVVNRAALLASYDPDSGTILIGKNASTGEVLYKALGMELMRRAQNSQYAEQLNTAVAQAAYVGNPDGYFADLQTVADELNKRFDNYGKRKLTAESPIVKAELFYKLAAKVFGNESSMMHLIEQNFQKPTLLQRIRNALKNFVQKLRGLKTPALTPIQRAEYLMGQALKDAQRAAANPAKAAQMLKNFADTHVDAANRQTLVAYTTMMGEEAALEVNGEMQYSGRAEEIQNAMAEEIDMDTKSATPQYSIRTWAGSDYVTQRDEAAKRLAKSLNVSVAKAKKWIDDVNSVSAYVLNHKARLDYIPTEVEGVSAFKSNPEYGGSIDMSTICAKRRLATGTLDAIQRELGDVALTKDDFLHIREMMKERGHEVACGLCFVESSRKNLSKYNKQFLDQYNSTHPGSELTMGDLNTVDGLERLRLRNQEAYAEYEKFMNKLAQRKPKLFEKRTEYNHEILSKFKRDTTVGDKNRHGGLRLQSFSDFEIVHLIDMMQVITDMASVGLAGQAYTKVPDFAWALGDTGLKINLSLIAKDVDENGNLIFDDVEGMNHNEAKRIRDRYSENVGTIVVTFTDEQLMAAMKSDFVDFIIPFHRSQWQKSDYKTLGLPEGTKDYTMHQNEKEGRKRVKENYAPNEYWNFRLTGKQNAENYLKKCAKDGRTPKFAKFLVNNGDGSYSLQPDGSTDGYWKLLIDFKMYDNQGKGSKQMPVKPNFNMEEAMRMLEEYKGEHDSFPAAQDVVDDFVKEFKGNRGGVKNTGGRYSVNNVQYSTRDAAAETTVREYLADADDSMAVTVEERNALQIYQDRLQAHAEATQDVLDAENAMKGKDGEELKNARAELARARAAQREQYNLLLKLEGTDHIQSVMQRTQQFITEEIAGKTREEIAGMISEREQQIRQLEQDLEGLKGAARAQLEADIRDNKRVVRALKNKATYKLEKRTEEFRAREQKAREYRRTRDEVNKLRRSIGRNIKRLNTLRVRETDQKHVPQEYQAVVDAVMRTFTDSSLSRLAFSAEKTASLQRTYGILKELESDMSYYWDDEIAEDIELLTSLSEAYTALRTREGGVPSTYSLEGVQLETEILRGVDAIVSNVMRMIDSANDAFIAGRTETFEQYASKTGDILLKQKDAKRRGKLLKGLDEMLRTGNMTPVYFIEHLNNPMIKNVFDQIRKGQSQYGKIVAEGQSFVQDAKQRYHYGRWVGDGSLRMKTSQGHNITLTREQAAWVYATAKREANNKLMQTEHLLMGGFEYKDIKTAGKDVLDKPHQLDAADIAKIGEWLTAEQKAYADALVGFLSDRMAEYGNQASMDMFGYKKFLEQYYFPFKTKADQRYLRGDEGASGEDAGTGRVKNSGFTKKLQHKANATLVMDDFTTVVTDHIQQMAMYSAMVEPIENLKRLLNYKVLEEDGTIQTVRALIGQKYGEPAQKYLTQLLKDLNGAAQGDTRAMDIVSKAVGAFKRGAVMASASVVLQQPTAVARAMAYINPKYFMNNPFYRPSKGLWQKMMKYAGTAVIKDMGKFDVGLGMTASQYIADEHLGVFETYRRLKNESRTKAGKAAYDRFMERLTAAPGLADQWTWGLIWQAVEKEQAALYPQMDHNSDEFLTIVGERFDDVVDHTQVYDSVLTRSNLMRSKNAFHQMATSFMSEPTLSLNMLYDMVKGKHTGKQRAAIFGSVIASQVLAGAMAALVQAWNDDDDKRNWLEKYTDRAAGNVFDNLNPLGMIPYVSDLISLLQGYDVERPDMTVAADILQYGERFFKAFEDGGAPTYKQVEDFVGTITNLVGIPYKNISREVRRTWNAITGTNWSEPNMTNVGFVAAENVSIFGFINPWGGEKKDYYERMITAMQKGDEDLVEDYRTYMLDSKMVEEDKITEGVRDAYKDRYEEGGIERTDAVKFLTDNGIAEDKDEAYWMLEKWEYEMDNGSLEGHKKLYELYAALDENNAGKVKAAIKEMTDHGYTESEAESEVNSYLNKQYKEGKITFDRLKQISAQYGGRDDYDEDDWYWEQRRLDTDDEDYKKLGKLYAALDSESGMEIKAAMEEMTLHGYTESEAESEVNSYLRKQCIKGKITFDKYKKLSSEYGGRKDYDNHDWYWEQKRVDYGKANGGSTEGYSKYKAFDEAVETGVNLINVIKEYTNHGVEKKTLAARITEAYKPILVDLYQTNRAEFTRVQARVLTAYAQLGYDREQKRKLIESWVK